MKKLYETLSVDVVKFEAQDVITASGVEVPINKEDQPVEEYNPDGADR